MQDFIKKVLEYREEVGRAYLNYTFIEIEIDALNKAENETVLLKGLNIKIEDRKENEMLQILRDIAKEGEIDRVDTVVKKLNRLIEWKDNLKSALQKIYKQDKLFKVNKYIDQFGNFIQIAIDKTPIIREEALRQAVKNLREE